MKYDNPELREKLAAEYVLGTMPILARRRFERLLGTDPELVRVVENWTSRFGVIDRGGMAEEPPARVWQAIEQRLGPAPRRERQGWLGSLAFWRELAFAATAVALAMVVYVYALAPPGPAKLVAVLNDDAGEPGWVALSSGRSGDVAVAPLHAVALDAAHSFELWAIAGGTPRPLGLLPVQPGRQLIVQAALVPRTGGMLAVSLEPAGGSPTGLPTGPVQFKGNVVAGEP
jgi:anti-sigma-K factor RskA